MSTPAEKTARPRIRDLPIEERRAYQRAANKRHRDKMKAFTETIRAAEQARMEGRRLTRAEQARLEEALARRAAANHRAYEYRARRMARDPEYAKRRAEAQKAAAKAYQRRKAALLKADADAIRAAKPLPAQAVLQAARVLQHLQRLPQSDVVSTQEQEACATALALIRKLYGMDTLSAPRSPLVTPPVTHAAEVVTQGNMP